MNLISFHMKIKILIEQNPSDFLISQSQKILHIQWLFNCYYLYLQRNFQMNHQKSKEVLFFKICVLIFHSTRKLKTKNKPKTNKWCNWTKLITCSWRDKLIKLWILNRQAKIFLCIKLITVFKILKKCVHDIE